MASIVLATGLAGAGGCRIVQTKAPAPTQSDRLMQAYPELRKGRFAVIADFEDPAHMELIQFIRTSPQAECDLDRKGGRPDTGRGCLRLTTGSRDDAVVINNGQAQNWYLQHDWRPYDLLLVSVESPQPDLGAEIVIAAGQEAEGLAVHSSIPLRRGWNVLRLDLAEVAEHLPLDEVREIRLAVGGVKAPVTLRVDDLILTGNREDLFGNSRNQTGELYVQRAGRRWNVGAGGRFELTFANGQIVRWHNLAADPYRLRNLVQGTTLGPSPVGVDSLGSEGTDFTGFGSAVVTRPQILEMSAVRVVVASEWHFVDDPNGPLDNRPFQRWVYTIYATGQVFVAVRYTASTSVWSPGKLGLAVTLAGSEDDDVETRTVTATEDEPGYATARNRSADAFLLYVPSEEEPPVRLTEQVNELRRRVSFVAARETDDGAAEESWACHLLLASARAVTDEEAGARAQAYRHPPGLRVEVGSSVTPDEAPVGPEGFDPADGCYLVRPDRGRARFIIDGRRQPCFSPAFRILSTESRAAQVYINHLVFDEVAYDRDGNLVFQLPGGIRDRTIVEVLLRGSPGPEGG